MRFHMLVGCLAFIASLRLSREAISMGGGRRIRTSTSDLFRCLGHSSLKLVFTLLLLDVLVKPVAADPSQSICTNSERVVAPGLATPKKLEERSCAVTTNSLCAWVAASFLTENVARAVTGANTQPLAGEFNEQWFGASTRRRGLAAADSGVSQQEYITKGGFVTLLCSSSGNTCTSPSYAVHADENESWEEHFEHQLEQSKNVQGTLLSAMREVNTTLAKTMQENIAAALEVAGEDGAWFSSPFLLCGNAVQDFVAGSSSRQSDGSIKLTSCLTARPGSSLPGFDVGIMLYATFHIRVIPPESLPEAFHAVRARLPRDDPTGNRTEGLVAMSYFLDVEDGEVLPCDSRIVLPCTIVNVKLLASRIKADFFSCGRDERCINSVIEGVTRYTRYTIGKEITQDYFYAFIVDEQGDFIAHGANSALVGRNLNDIGSEATDFHGRRAFNAIHNASVRDDGFGSYATYLWPSASCQNSLTGGTCEPLVKNALTFSVRTLRTKLIVGVGSNHMRPPFPVKDPSAPALGFCSDAYSLPCADEAARRLVSYTQSALRSSNSGKVFADITSGSSEYKAGNFYVFILDFKSAEFLAHGAIPSFVEEKVTIINAASSVGLRPDQLSGDALFMDMQERAEMGGGYVAYNWTHPVYAVVPKISFMLGFRISDGDSALRDVIIGSGFYLSAAPQILESTKNGRQQSCSLTMNTACSRRMVLSKVGYTLSTFIDAMTIGKEAVANTIQNMNMNEIVDERVIINSQKDWPGRDSQWANIGVSLFHRLQGTLIASNKPCRDGNGTWGMRYSGMTEAFILKAEGRYDSDNSYSQESQKASDDGGAFFEWETPHGNRWGYISQLVCSLDFLSSGDSCAYLIVDEANLGCGDGSRVIDDICIPCPAGEYLDTDKCVPCAPGSYSSRPGEKKCTLCRDLPDAQRRYQNATGATKCELCPDNTMRDLTDSATSIVECHCAEGFYQQDLLPNGALCSPCEEGGVCPGALGKINLEPYPQPGYWGQRGYPSEFLECELGEFACKGGENFTCADERHGTLCTLCGKGYFKAYATGWDGGPSGEGACYKCADGFLQWIYTALMTSAIFAVWFGLNEVPYEALNVSLEFMQISDIIGKFSLEWPATMASFWQVLSQIVNFDPDIVVMWQCHMPWDFKDGFLLLMVLPFVKVTAIGFFHLAKYISLYLIRTGRIQKFPRGLLTTQKEMDDSDDILINELIAFHHILYLALTERAFDIFATAPRPDGVEFIEEAPWIDVNSSSYAGLQILGSFAIAVYVIGMPAFFAWVLFYGKAKDKLSSPSYLVRYGFLYTRYDAEFYFWELIVILRRVLLVAVLKFMADDPMLQAAAGLILCGLFLAMQAYSRPYSISYLDKLEFAACMLNMFYIVAGLVETFSTSAVMKLFFEITITIVFCAVSIAIISLLYLEHSYETSRKNAVRNSSERFTRILLEEIVPRAPETMDMAKDRVRRILGASRAAFRVLDSKCDGVVSPTEFMKNFPILYGERKGGRQMLTDDQAYALTDLIGGGTVHRDIEVGFVESEFLVHIGHELMRANDEVVDLRTGEENDDAGVAKDLLALGLSKTFVSDGVEAFSKIIDDISDFKQSFAATHVNFEVEQFNVEDNVKLMTESLFAEMLTTLDSYALEALFSRDVSKADAVEILRLESILDTVVGDSAEVSEYAHNSKAEVYRALIGALPCLLEFFSDPEKSSHEDCAAVARMMAFVEENHKLNNNYSSRFSDMISPFDLAPLLEWIIRSSDGDRSSFLWLVSVVDACRNDTSTLDGRVSRSRSVSKRFNDWVKEVNIPARVIAPQSGNGGGKRDLRATSLPLRRSQSLLNRMATAKSPWGREEEEPKDVGVRHVNVAPKNGFGPTISSMKNKDDEVTRVNVQQAWV